jgi:hypothetical protein
MSRRTNILRRAAALIAPLATLLAAPSALAQGVCGSASAGNCCTANTTPGCSNVACCKTICAADPFCCNTRWDSICAQAANSQCASCLVLTVAHNGCAGTTLTFPPIVGAAGYSVFMERQLSCSVCGVPGVATMETVEVPVFTSTSSSITMPRTPAFSGRWKVTVRNAAGATLIELFSPAGVSQPSTGAPYTGVTAETRNIDPGMSTTLTATSFTTSVTTYQWFRDSAPIPGASGPTYTATVAPLDPSVVTYRCVLTNGCGESQSNPFNVVKSSCAALLPVQLRSHTETESLSLLAPLVGNYTCWYDFAPTVRSGTCAAEFADFGATTIGLSMDVPLSDGANRAKSSVTAFTVLANTSLNVNLSGTAGFFNTVGTVSLAGPVSYSATATTTAPVNRTDVLPAGNYTLTVTIANGNLGCRNCASCGPSCQQNCGFLAQPRALTMLATFDLEGPCGSPSAGDCCVAHQSPGCSDAACCLTVCAADPFCCNTAWDSICANAAGNVCASCAPLGDLNGDNTVNSSDLAILLGAWGSAGADLDGDGTTNSADLAILLGNWG